MSRRLGLVIALILTVALSACGVPTSSKPIVDGDVRATTTQSDNTPPVPAENQFYMNPIDFIERGYLTAVAAQVNPAAQAAAAKAYMASDAAWQPPAANEGLQPVTVIRRIGSPTQTTFEHRGATADADEQVIELTETVQVVGVLDPVSGELVPAAAAQDRSLTFSVVGSDDHYRLESAPAGYYMIDSALSELNEYTPQIVYFLSSAQDGGLIPDLRYLPTWLAPRTKATQVVNWILNGPPTWMKSVTKPSVPDRVILADSTVSIEKGNFVVNLSATTMAAQQQKDFLNEVRWSLGSIPATTDDTDELQPVVLQIANRSVLDGTEPQPSGNQSANRDPSPDAYAISNGKVITIGTADNSSGQIRENIQANSSVPALAGAVNKNVLLAAISTSPGQPTEVAFVKAGVGGKQDLLLDRDGDDGKSSFSEVALHPATFSRPVWLTQAPGQLAVVADGRLYIIGADNKPELVAITAGPDAPITTFAMAQDGYRIAIVSGGQLSIALLSLAAAGAPALTTPTPINVKPSIYRVDAVTWETIDQLVVAGSSTPTGNVAAVIETKCDGHFNGANPELSQQSSVLPTISEISAYALSPLATEATSPVMGQTATYAYSGRATPKALSSDSKENLRNPFFPD